jgi:predicted Zn-dependent protease
MFSVLSVVALRRVYPPGNSRKRLALLVLAGTLALAGCGGGGGGSTTSAGSSGGGGQEVKGAGFTFHAPDDWTVKTSATSALASQDKDTLVSVTVLPLVKPYRPTLFLRVARELDRVADDLAKQLGGQVVSSNTVIAAKARARQYEIEHDGLVDRITFVLRGKREYQLTCRWKKADGRPAACDQLSASFSL